VSAGARDDNLSHELMALAAEIKRLDGGDTSESARVANVVMLRFGEALAMAIDRIPDRADEIALATVRAGVTATRRLFAEVSAELVSICRLVQAIKLADEAERRRVLEILSDPLAAFAPALALVLCTNGIAAAAAIEILRINGVNAVPLSADPGGSRVQ